MTTTHTIQPATPTPGPWQIESDTDVLSESGAFVATTHDPRSDIGTASEYANARLIAAAPDLLASSAEYLEAETHLQKCNNEHSFALKTLGDQHGDTALAYSRCNRAADRHEAAGNALRAAIAHAKGQGGSQ